MSIPSLPGYDSWKLSNGETKEDRAFITWYEAIEADLREQFLETDKYENAFQDWVDGLWQRINV